MTLDLDLDLDLTYETYGRLRLIKVDPPRECEKGPRFPISVRFSLGFI